MWTVENSEEHLEFVEDDSYDYMTDLDSDYDTDNDTDNFEK